MPKQESIHKIAVIAFNGVVVGDLSTPLSLFPLVKDRHGQSNYSVAVCSSAPSIQTDFFSLSAPHTLKWATSADTIIIPGLTSLDIDVPGEVIELLQECWSNGARIISLCTGAFVLASAGILAGIKATTHWAAINELSLRYKDTRCVPNVLYVDEGRILTSAGATAAFDLCLYVIRQDCGSDMANRIADLAMVPVERIGIQPQLNYADITSENDVIFQIMKWIEDNLHQAIPLESLSDKFNLSTRSLTRLFIKSSGLPPGKWITTARINKAKTLLESENIPIDTIADLVGYSSAEIFRENFRRISNLSPTAYRRIYRQDIGKNNLG